MVKNMSGLDNIPRPKVCDIYDQVPTGVDRMSEAAPHILTALGEEVADDSDLTPAEHIDRIYKISRLRLFVRQGPHHGNPLAAAEIGLQKILLPEHVALEM